MTRISLDEDHREALERAFSLKSEGKGWDEIIPMLRNEGILESPDEDYDPLTLESWREPPPVKTLRTSAAPRTVKWKRSSPEDMKTIPETPSSVTLNTVELLSISSEICSGDAKTSAEDDRMQDPMARLAIMVRDMESRLAALLDERIRAALSPVSCEETRDSSCFPPYPPKLGKAGKKFAGDKRDLRVRIDRNLFTLLKKEAEDRHGGNMSQCLDAVLWRYYDQPDLSFQQSGSKQEV